MYQPAKYSDHQYLFMDFNQSCGMQLDETNEWVRLADRIPWYKMEAEYALPGKHIDNYLTVITLCEQQKYMFDNKVHSVPDRIVSISQPYIRPIVRGKAKFPVESGAKYDVSIDEKGYARFEKITFDPYNESKVFQDALERYKSVPATTLNGFWLIRYTEPGII